MKMKDEWMNEKDPTSNIQLLISSDCVFILIHPFDLAFHCSDHARYLFDGNSLFAIQVGFADRQTHRHFAHTSALHKFHFQNVVNDPLGCEATLTFGLHALNGVVQYCAQSIRRVAVVILQGAFDDFQSQQWAVDQFGAAPILAQRFAHTLDQTGVHFRFGLDDVSRSVARSGAKFLQRSTCGNNVSTVEKSFRCARRSSRAAAARSANACRVRASS